VSLETSLGVGGFLITIGVFILISRRP